MTSTREPGDCLTTPGLLCSGPGEDAGAMLPRVPKEGMRLTEGNMG